MARREQIYWTTSTIPSGLWLVVLVNKLV